MYGFPAGGFSLRLVSSLRTAVVAALWSTTRRGRCREIVLTLFVKGHLVDPSQNASYQSLRQLRRMAEQRPETFAELDRVWRCYANGGEMCDGPAATVHSILQGMGWHWQAPTLFTREGRPHLRLLDGPVRLAEWKTVGNRRNDMRGVESTAGIDKLATTNAMISTKMPPDQRNDFEHKRGSLTARERNPLCVCFVVRNLKMKSICSGGARGGKRFASRSKLQATVIA